MRPWGLALVLVACAADRSHHAALVRKATDARNARALDEARRALLAREGLTTTERDEAYLVVAPAAPDADPCDGATVAVTVTPPGATFTAAGPEACAFFWGAPELWVHDSEGQRLRLVKWPNASAARDAGGRLVLYRLERRVVATRQVWCAAPNDRPDPMPGPLPAPVRLVSAMWAPAEPLRLVEGAFDDIDVTCD